MDGNWGGWRGFGSCSVTCGTGVQNATRRCDYPPPTNGGKDCDGEMQQFRTRLCQQPPCKGNSRVFLTKDTGQQLGTAISEVIIIHVKVI